MKVYAEVLTAISSDTPGTSVILHFDSKRYIFGQFAEGLQRAVIERRARLGKVSDLFLSGPTEWRNTGGLVAIILSMGDPDGTRTSSVVDVQHREKQTGITIHGGTNLMHTLSTMRRFVFRTGMNLKVNEIERDDPEFRDENISVRTLHVGPDCSYIDATGVKPDTRDRKEFLNKVVHDMFCSSWTMNTMLDEQSTDTGGERNPQLSTKAPPKGKTRAPWPASTIDCLPHTAPQTIALSYIVQLHEQRGKFLPAVAKKLGVKPGLDFSRLTSGQSVTTASGTVVSPHEVMEPPREGTGIAICDIPSPAYLSGFIKSPEWADLQGCQRRLGCFFWLLGKNVVYDLRFQNFTASFPNSRHIIGSVDICPDRINFKSAAKAATLLNSLDPLIFVEPSIDSNIVWLEGHGYDLAFPGLYWQIEPKWQLKRDTIEPSFSRSDVLKSDVYKSLISTTKEISYDSFRSHRSPGGDVEVYTLGTGSSLPSKYRNVSSTLVRIPKFGSLLLDCGEGTLGQLRRSFSGEAGKIGQVLADIKAIYISHLHADHHLGFISLIKAKWALDPDQDIFVIGPWVFHKWLTEYRLVEPQMDKIMGKIAFIASECLCSRRSQNETQPESLQLLLQALSLSKIETAGAIHCLSSFTIAFTFDLDGEESPFKLSYSGDTRPSTEFIEIGKDSTILIHEATFDDDMTFQAKAKKHSTIGEALEVAKKMGAHGIILTHFSQRYPKLVLDDGKRRGMHVVFAFDCMRIRVADVCRFARMRKGLEMLYGDHAED